jgi:hypothetical protein
MRRSIKQLVWATLILAGCQSEDRAGSASDALKQEDDALAYASSVLLPQIEARSKENGFTEDDTWVLRDTPLLDERGYAIARFDRYHAGIRVVGGDIITHSKLDQGLPVEALVSRLTKPITTPIEIVIDKDLARRIAVAGTPIKEAGDASLVLWAVDGHREVPRLAWDVAVGSRQVIVSADQGKVIDAYGTIHTGECGEDMTCTAETLTARPFYTPGTYSISGARRSVAGAFVDYGIHDLSRDIRVRYSRFTRAEADGLVWALIFGVDLGQGSTTARTSRTFGNGRLFDGRDTETSLDRFTPAGELQLNLDRVYGFYASRFGRYGFAGRRTICFRPPGDVYPCIRGTAPISATVNVPMSNAAFDSRRGKLWFGYDHAAAPTRGPLVELDVVAHEFAHAVTHNTARLVYTDSHSGALNESMSDVFGRSATFANDPSVLYTEQAWWVGAGMTTPDVANDAALRYMDDPERDGHSLRHVSDYPAAGIDPHYGSGIPNFVFALLGQWIGWEPAMKIWYRALTTCFTESTTFHDARICTYAAAETLYPMTGPHDDIPNWVQSAWNVVGVY